MRSTPALATALTTLLVGGCIGVGPSGVSLVPPIDASAPRRDPDPTAPLFVQTEPPATREVEQPPGDGPGNPLPPELEATLGALTVYLLTGMRPLIGWWGTFDESAKGFSRATKRAAI